MAEQKSEKKVWQESKIKSQNAHEPQTIHMMGICGTAMASLAGLLKEMGYHVRGSDQNVYPPMSTKLQSLGIPILEGYKPENLEPRPDKVIVGNVMTRNHSEVQALLQSDIPYTSLPKAMGEYLIGDRHSVVITGTHGKTTTTALAAWTLAYCGVEPGFMIGGVPLNFPQSFEVGQGDYFVIEGDEYDTAFFDKVPKFIHYKPRTVILTSIEFDHADIYKDLDAVKDAFKMLLKLIPEDGHLIYEGDDQNIKSILNETRCKNRVSYGAMVSQDSEWKLGRIAWQEKYAEFEVMHRGEVVDVLAINLFGEYNLLNALGVYAMARELGLAPDKIKEAFSQFKGVKRRQEIIGTPRDITVIEDFAHHPTAVRVTIDGIKRRFPRSKLIAVFEPRSATSRRKVFQDEYVKAFGKADYVVIAQAYDQSKIAESERFDSAGLVAQISKNYPNVTAKLGQDGDAIIGLVKNEAQPGNVVLIMSNGGFGGIYQKLLQALA